MIRFLIDINEILADSKNLVVRDNHSYLITYQKVQEALQNNENLIIILRKRIFQVWFERMCQRLDTALYSFETISLRSLLAEKWNCTIPGNISDNEIKDLHLLDLEEIPSQNESFNDFILRYFFDAILTKKSFDIEFFQDLINVFSPSKWGNRLSNPVFKVLFADRIELWKKSSDKAVKRLFDKLLDSAEGFITEIHNYSVLRFYKGLGRKYIKDFSIYESLKIPFKRLKKRPDLETSLIGEIEVEINSWEVPTDKEEILSFIGRCSGMVLIEFKKIEDLLNSRAELISEEVITGLRNKFLRFYPNLRPRIDHILFTVPPSLPPEFQSDWSTEDIKEWVVRYYFPYYKWTIECEKETSLINKLGSEFSDWYFQHYEETRLSSKSILCNFISNNFNELSEAGTLDFVILLDNFPAIFGDLLKTIFMDSGFLKKSEDYYFSHVPTITEISKLFLLAGTSDKSVIEDVNYKKVLEEGGWLPFFGTNSFKYYPSIGRFKEESEWKSKVYFINYLLVDEILHKYEQDLGSKHNEYIESNLKILINAISEVIDKNKLKEKVRVHLISDHGSTYLIKQDPLIPQSVANSRKWQHYSNRYIELIPEDDTNLPPEVIENSYFLDSSKIGTLQNYLIAKGIKSLFKQNGNGWGHGGMQPEEVIIPHFVFMPVTSGVLMPYLALLDENLRFALQDIDIELVNPNDTILEQVYVSILNSNFESDLSTIRVDKLASKSKDHVKFSGKFNQTRNEFEKQYLKCGIEFEIEGQQFSTEVNLKINIRKIIETKGTDIFDNF